jgi:hypothetical protein
MIKLKRGKVKGDKRLKHTTVRYKNNFWGGIK